MPKPKIVAFLQNQWFRNPERVRQIFARQPDARELYITNFLFMGCRTGKNLLKAFGEQLCEYIIWEEQSPCIGERASSKFPPDLAHIRYVLTKHQPDIILAFGTSARSALIEIHHYDQASWKLLIGPHPAARQPGTMARLLLMKEYLDQHLESFV